MIVLDAEKLGQRIDVIVDAFLLVVLVLLLTVEARAKILASYLSWHSIIASSGGLPGFLG